MGKLGLAAVAVCGALIAFWILAGHAGEPDQTDLSRQPQPVSSFFYEATIEHVGSGPDIPPEVAIRHWYAAPDRSRVEYDAVDPLLGTVTSFSLDAGGEGWNYDADSHTYQRYERPGGWKATQAHAGPATMGYLHTSVQKYVAGLQPDYLRGHVPGLQARITGK